MLHRTDNGMQKLFYPVEAATRSYIRKQWQFTNYVESLSVEWVSRVGQRGNSGHVTTSAVLALWWLIINCFITPCCIG